MGAEVPGEVGGEGQTGGCISGSLTASRGVLVRFVLAGRCVSFLPAAEEGNPLSFCFVLFSFCSVISHSSGFCFLLILSIRLESLSVDSYSILFEGSTSLTARNGGRSG